MQDNPEARVVAPPRFDAVLSNTADTASTACDHHIQTIVTTGRMAWQKTSGYNQRANVERQIGHWKQVLEPVLRFHTYEAQAVEIAIGTLALNSMLDLGCSNSVRVA